MLVYLHKTTQHFRMLKRLLPLSSLLTFSCAPHSGHGDLMGQSIQLPLQIKQLNPETHLNKERKIKYIS